MTESGDELRVPKHRFDDESRKRQDAEARLEKLEQDLEDSKKERDEAASNYKSLYETEQRKTARLQNQVAALEGERDTANTTLIRERKRSAFVAAAAHVIRDDAIEDAFALVSDGDLEKLDHTDAKGFGKVAQKLVDAKPYLANGKGGAGSGGSARPVQVGDDPNKPRQMPWERNQKRRIS